MVREKPLQGGGLVPVTGGEDHIPGRGGRSSDHRVENHYLVILCTKVYSANIKIPCSSAVAIIASNKITFSTGGFFNKVKTKMGGLQSPLPFPPPPPPPLVYTLALVYSKMDTSVQRTISMCLLLRFNCTHFLCLQTINA